MIKRSIHSRFVSPVLAGKKTTTIRDKTWPVGKPIMLFAWSGKPYRSPHSDVCAVMVRGYWTVRITHSEDGTMHYECGRVSEVPLFVCEGFSTQEEMDTWFRAVVPRGTTTEKKLMNFAIITGERNAK